MMTQLLTFGALDQNPETLGLSKKVMSTTEIAELHPQVNLYPH
jgi:hypothetical protein